MLHSPPHAGRFSPEVLWGQAVEPGFSFHINAQPFTVACYPDRGLPAGLSTEGTGGRERPWLHCNHPLPLEIINLSGEINPAAAIFRTIHYSGISFPD